LHPDYAARMLLRAQGTVGSAGRQVVLSLAKADARLDVDGRGMLILARAHALDLPLTRIEFVVVDVETTGTHAGAARLTEVGAVRVRDGRCLDTFARLVDPGLPVPSAITRLTGITAAMLQGAPPFARIAVDWLDFLGNGVLVAHNAPFDCSFLNHELIRCGEVPPPNPVLCSVRLARRLLPHLRSHCLDSLARHLGLRFRQRHRALGDAEVTAQLLLVLLERASARGLTTLGELQKLLEGPVPAADTGAEDMLGRPAL
ncbi:MAG: exonuclease domain-containing protein, partial [Planctomycetota bacterium]